MPDRPQENTNIITLDEAQEAYLMEKEAFLDAFIDQDNDELLFVSSYIHGHFSVVAANMSSSPDSLENLESFKAHFEAKLRGAIEHAINNHELSERDEKSVAHMLDQLFAS